MGYSYTMSGRLCCDVCGAAGARKIRCPSGYCQSIAQCPTCRKDPAKQARIAKSHEHCAEYHARFVAEEAEKARKLAAGLYVLASALTYRETHVHVLFRNQAGAYVGYYMPAELYGNRLPNAYPTPDDFAALGPITPAPSDFNHKEIAA